MYTYRISVLKYGAKPYFKSDAPGSGSFNVCFFINHNILLVVRVVGLLFALEMAISGSNWLWAGLALQTKVFLAQLNWLSGVQLFKSKKMSLL